MIIPFRLGHISSELSFKKPLVLEALPPLLMGMQTKLGATDCYNTLQVIGASTTAVLLLELDRHLSLALFYPLMTAALICKHTFRICSSSSDPSFKHLSASPIARAMAAFAREGSKGSRMRRSCS